MQQLVRAARVLSTQGWLEQAAVGIDGGRIAWLGPSARAPQAQTEWDLGEAMLAPGFIDLQVNGGGGVLLNDDSSVSAMRRIAAAHRRFGTTGILPTLISDTPEATRAALAAAREAVTQRVPGVLGLHLEGPYLSPERRGVHRAENFRQIQAEERTALLAHGLPHLLITLAPEAVAPPLLRELRAAGIRLSAGHSAATFEQAEVAFAAGVDGVTHLFNAMNPISARAPGLLGAALLNTDVWAGLIVDGHHLHPASLQLALRMKPERCFLVSDAMSPLGTSMREFMLDGRRVLVRDDRLETEDGTLAGACIDLCTAVRVCREQSGIALEEVLRMATTYPADFLGLPERGRIEVGAWADLVHLSPDLRAQATWLEGQHQPSVG
ncbi:N-acetylglucosamine-6-phosphate deacetylase [Aquimonas voraii]|uniref:N-acetylglucosamine 6-phosphate deacetylase n=1 Tax=Aquimonas voraii TaxID=265719 RepID=A0A1G6SY75_9GAMM|nr:N-acetylglucosamine-6-phosphate deacetylase [Aquimonas voraii]SDD21701.1 N-acetylglucosamine 6-phosphate deacetylase [Aquimonas voraii]